jgi:hypothetical protein
VGVGIGPVVTEHDLAFLGDVGRHPGDELEIVHPLELPALGAAPVADLALRLEERKLVLGQDGADFDE